MYLHKHAYRLRQYRTRITQWGNDKNIKPKEMRAIVRKQQQRKLVEVDKGELEFKVRGCTVNPQKINRWMKRNNVADSFLYAPSPAACKLGLLLPTFNAYILQLRLLLWNAKLSLNVARQFQVLDIRQQLQLCHQETLC